MWSLDWIALVLLARCVAGRELVNPFSRRNLKAHEYHKNAYAGDRRENMRDVLHFTPKQGFLGPPAALQTDKRVEVLVLMPRPTTATTELDDWCADETDFPTWEWASAPTHDGYSFTGAMGKFEVADPSVTYRGGFFAPNYFQDSFNGSTSIVGLGIYHPVENKTILSIHGIDPKSGQPFLHNAKHITNMERFVDTDVSFRSNRLVVSALSEDCTLTFYRFVSYSEVNQIGSYKLEKEGTCTSYSTIGGMGPTDFIIYTVGAMDSAVLKPAQTKYYSGKFTFTTNSAVFEAKGEAHTFDGGHDGTRFAISTNKKAVSAVGWLGNDIYPCEVPSAGWRHGLTAMRQLTENSFGRLVQTPHPSLQLLRSGSMYITTEIMDVETKPCAIEVPLAPPERRMGYGLNFTFAHDWGFRGAGYEIHLISDSDPLINEQRVTFAFNKAAATTIQEHTYTINRTNTNDYGRPSLQKMQVAEMHRPYHTEMRESSVFLLVDRTVLEAYVEGVAMTEMFFTDLPFNRICVNAIGNDVRILPVSHAQVYQSMWERTNTAPASTCNLAFIVLLTTATVFIGVFL